MFSKKRMKRILKFKNKLHTKKNINKKKRYKKHNSFRKKKNNLRIQSIKKYKKKGNKKNKNRIAKKKRKAYIHKGGKKIKISNIFISNTNHVKTLHNSTSIKNSNSYQTGGDPENKTDTKIIDKYFPSNFLKDIDKLTIELLKDDDIMPTEETAHKEIEEDDKQISIMQQKQKETVGDIPDNCQSNLSKTGDTAFWVKQPPGNCSDITEIQKQIADYMGLGEFKVDLLTDL